MTVEFLKNSDQNFNRKTTGLALKLKVLLYFLTKIWYQVTKRNSIRFAVGGKMQDPESNS